MAEYLDPLVNYQRQYKYTSSPNANWWENSDYMPNYANYGIEKELDNNAFKVSNYNPANDKTWDPAFGWVNKASIPPIDYNSLPGYSQSSTIIPQNEYDNALKGGSANPNYTPWTNFGKKALGFLTSPTGAMLGGGLISGIASYNQAQEERKAIQQQNKQLAKSITEIQNSKSDFTNRLSGQSNTLMNQYAMNNNPNKDQFYATGYLNNTNTLNTGIQSMDNDITKMRSMMQRVPAKNNAWIAALSGAFGGGMGVKAMQNNINTANTSRQYQNWYDTNNLNDYYRR